jgi:hypothetical protein
MRAPDAADLAPELVSNRAELERYVELLVTGDGAAHPLAEGWRRDLVGDELRELVAGRVALASLAKPPYLAIIRQ